MIWWFINVKRNEGYMRFLMAFLLILVLCFGIDSKYGSEIIGKWCNTNFSSQSDAWVKFESNGDFIMGFGDWEENRGSWVISGDSLYFAIFTTVTGTIVIIPQVENYKGVYSFSGDTLVMVLILFIIKLY